MLLSGRTPFSRPAAAGGRNALNELFILTLFFQKSKEKEKEKEDDDHSFRIKEKAIRMRRCLEQFLFTPILV